MVLQLLQHRTLFLQRQGDTVACSSTAVTAQAMIAVMSVYMSSSIATVVLAEALKLSDNSSSKQAAKHL
jgi:hypothetical protein